MKKFYFNLCIKVIIILLTSVIFFQFIGCNEDSPVSTDPTNYGTTAKYEIKPEINYLIKDSISGGSFNFPEGGSGTITVRKIIQSDAINGEGNAFEIEAPANTKIQFLLKHIDGDIDYLLNYVSNVYATNIEDTLYTRWFSVPLTSSSNGYYIYNLNLQEVSIFNKSNKPNILSNNVSGKFATINFPKAVKAAITKSEFEKGIKEILDRLITVSPNPIIAQSKIDKMKWHAVVYNSKFWTSWPNARGIITAYRAFSPYLKSDLFEFMMLDDAQLSSVAHETGHYFQHILIGSENYKKIIALARNSHEIGSTLRSRYDLSEDPAYLTQLFIQGTINNSSVKQAGNFMQSDKHSPDQVDFPSLEGFATLMWGNLLIPNNQEIIQNFEMINCRIPKITSVTYKDIYTQIANNVAGVNESRTDLETVMSAKNEQDALPIILQQIGWNYRVKCRFIDQNKNPLVGVSARPVSIYDPKTYYLYYGVNPSDKDGNYVFNYFYPGKAIIRVYLNNWKDSIDLSPEIANIDWKKPTTEIINLGDITVSANQKSNIETVLIPAGSFKMGDGSSEISHNVTITKPFYIGKYEITNKQYNDVLPGLYTPNDFPVETCTWVEAVVFCNEASKREGLEQCYTISGSTYTCNFDKKGYRLPTEAEWEYACKGTGTLDGLAENRLLPYAWNNMNSGGTVHQIGQKTSTDYGLYDMLGNVSEWCWDWYTAYGSASVTNPTGPSTGSYRVLRGGNYNNPWSYCTYYFRQYSLADDYSTPRGIRIVRTK